jgi:hypothetical protein
MAITRISNRTTAPTIHTVGLFIQLGASAAAVDVVVCVSVELDWAEFASWANACIPDIRQRNRKKHFDEVFIIAFFISWLVFYDM